jgi:putative transposase
LLRAAFRTVESAHPFTIDAFVLLPDHRQCLRTLPPDDNNDSLRWKLIKKYCSGQYKLPCSPSQTVWQPRYREHQIRDDRDFEKHCDYIHWNPVKHGCTSHVADWPYSSFNRFVRHGIYPENWAGIPDSDDGFGE